MLKKIFYILISGATIFEGTPVFAQLSTEKLIAFYPFNGNAIDESGNGNDGIVYGATLTTDRFGVPNKAYFFNGISSYIYIPDAEILKITNQISMSAWFKTNSTKVFSGIICKANPLAPRTGYLMDIDDYQKARADICVDHPVNFCRIMSEKTVVDDQWHFMAAVYDGSVFKLYLDGFLEIEKEFLYGIGSNNEPLLIGWDENTWLSDRHFYGKIDEVRIYNRALDSIEINRLYGEESVTISGQSQICQGEDNVPYSVSNMSDVSSSNWTYDGDGVTINGSGENINLSFSYSATSGTLSVSGKKPGDTVSVTAEINITVSKSPIATASSNSPLCSGDIIHLNAPTVSGGDYTWSGPNGYTTKLQNPVISDADSAHSGNYYLTIISGNCISQPSLTNIQVDNCENSIPGEFNIPNAFSPNKDGINEFFTIRGLKKHSSLTIFNRLGGIIYKSADYNNDWDGKDMDGRILDSDTYWYVLIIPDIPVPLRGFIYLKR